MGEGLAKPWRTRLARPCETTYWLLLGNKLICDKKNYIGVIFPYSRLRISKTWISSALAPSGPLSYHTVQVRVRFRV